MTNLTKNEAAAMIASLNYTDRENQLSDNYSNASIEVLMQTLDWSAQQVGGLISSLTDKGFGFIDGENGLDGILWLTEAGVNAIFDYIEKNSVDIGHNEGTPGMGIQS
jgi:hypothetical protein